MEVNKSGMVENPGTMDHIKEYVIQYTICTNKSLFIQNGQKRAYIAQKGTKWAKMVKNGPISKSRKDREILNRIFTPAIWW